MVETFLLQILFYSEKNIMGLELPLKLNTTISNINQYMIMIYDLRAWT